MAKVPVKIVLWAFICAIAFLVLFLSALAAFAHGEHAWMQKYSNGLFSCCDRMDIAYIAHWEANALHVGDLYTATFPSGARTVEIRKIYPTEDHEGRAAISKYGCLFRSYGL